MSCLDVLLSHSSSAFDFNTLQAYVHPSRGLMAVVIVMVVTIVVLAASIMVLQRREKYQDAIEKQITAHAFL